MLLRSIVILLMVTLFIPSIQANTTIVDDDFDSYADDAALYSVWQPRDGGGNDAPVNADDGILTADDTLFPGISGQAVDHLGGSVMQHVGLTAGAELFPTATESIHVQGDIFVGNDGNSRTTIGLRNRTSTGNILELGTWNADGVDPFDPTDPPAAVATTTYAYRLVLQLYRKPSRLCAEAAFSIARFCVARNGLVMAEKCRANQALRVQRCFGIGKVHLPNIFSWLLS